MLPPESVPTRVETLGRLDVELLHELAGALVDDAALDPAAPPERRLADPLEEEVDPDRERAARRPRASRSSVT